MKKSPLIYSRGLFCNRVRGSDFARMFDNSFTLADNFIAILTNGVPLNYYDTRIEYINNATPEVLLQTAQNYLPSFEDMLLVVAGNY